MESNLTRSFTPDTRGLGVRGPKFTLVTIIFNQVAVRASMLTTNGLMDWTVENTKLLDKLTTVLTARMLSRTTMHFRHVIKGSRRMEVKRYEN